jgi:tetratricopeptide (TPR) repeat protein
MKRVFCSLLVTLLLICSLLAASTTVVNPGVEAKLRFAAAQHEIISILINEGQYDRVLPEFEKILELGLTGEQEQLVVKEVWSIVTALTEAGQYDSAHRLLDEALAKVAQQDNRFALLMLKGKVYKQEGRLREALGTYRQAQQLQER